MNRDGSINCAPNRHDIAPFNPPRDKARHKGKTKKSGSPPDDAWGERLCGIVFFRWFGASKQRTGYEHPHHVFLAVHSAPRKTAFRAEGCPLRVGSAGRFARVTVRVKPGPGTDSCHGSSYLVACYLDARVSVRELEDDSDGMREARADLPADTYSSFLRRHLTRIVGGHHNWTQNIVRVRLAAVGY
jgi:hypothetical protein